MKNQCKCECHTGDFLIEGVLGCEGCLINHTQPFQECEHKKYSGTFIGPDGLTRCDECKGTYYTNPKPTYDCCATSDCKHIGTKHEIKYDERKAREKTIKGKLYDIITENEPMVAISLIVENLPKFYEFLTPKGQ